MFVMLKTSLQPSRELTTSEPQHLRIKRKDQPSGTNLNDSQKPLDMNSWSAAGMRWPLCGAEVCSFKHLPASLRVNVKCSAPKQHFSHLTAGWRFDPHEATCPWSAAEHSAGYWRQNMVLC